jgi:DNA polymerase-3 subunit epsilon
VIWSFARELKARVETKELSAAIEALVQLPVQTRGEVSQIWQRVPSVPGVYVFYDADGSALYVGKSANLRSRILADLEGQAARLEHLRHLQQATLEWIETAGSSARHCARSSCCALSHLDTIANGSPARRGRGTGVLRTGSRSLS